MNRPVRQGPAYAMLIFGRLAPPAMALPVIERGIADDPGAADLLVAKSVFALELGDDRAGEAAFRALARLAPRSFPVRRSIDAAMGRAP